MKTCTSQTYGTHKEVRNLTQWSEKDFVRYVQNTAIFLYSACLTGENLFSVKQYEHFTQYTDITFSKNVYRSDAAPSSYEIKLRLFFNNDGSISVIRQTSVKIDGTVHDADSYHFSITSDLSAYNPQGQELQILFEYEGEYIDANAFLYGMTWQDFCDSEYNLGEWSYDSDGVYLDNMPIQLDGTPVISSDNVLAYSAYSFVE